MDDQTDGAAPRRISKSLDASVRDIAEGRVHDAKAVQAEARRMLADHQGAGSVPPAQRRDGLARRTRSNS